MTDACAVVPLVRLKTLWINSGSLCNISCLNCYMLSTPVNDDLEYIKASEVRKYLDEIAARKLPVEEIGFTGGEPFMNPDIISMLDEALNRGFLALLLTNAMKPMWLKRNDLLKLGRRHGDKITVRVSIDHYTPEKHESLRGQGSFAPMARGLTWLADNGFKLAIAGRSCWNEDEAKAREGYAKLFAKLPIPLDAFNPSALTLFPEMVENADAPKITKACFGLLGVDPQSIMCASSRMVIKRKGAPVPAVVSCTLLPYEASFEMGFGLAAAAKAVKISHPHCAVFCVLGGASCAV